MAFIEFTNPTILIIGIIFTILMLISILYLSKKKKTKAQKTSISSFMKKVIKKNSIKDKLITYILILCVFLLFFALSDPMMRLSGEKEGVNVVLVIDSSGSMQANDFTPNRMEAAKYSAKLLVDELKPKDNVGVVSFSTSTRITSFLTNDKERVQEKIDTIQVGGQTAIGDALAMGVEMVTSIPNKKKLIILLSDGEQTTGSISIDDSIFYAKSNEVVVYTIGVGKEDKTLLGHDWFGRAQYAVLDEESLQKIALNTNGEYFRAQDNLELDEIYEKLPELVKKEKELQSIKDYVLILTLLLLISTFFIKYWKKIKVW